MTHSQMNLRLASSGVVGIRLKSEKNAADLLAHWHTLGKVGKYRHLSSRRPGIEAWEFSFQTLI